MSDELQVVNTPEQKTAATPIDQAALLKDLVARIRHDSVQESDEYLNETTVPHGGE